ncbi:GNAT family N-acetyltransferase [uncultured Methanomethylovorans sp.]|uniref:GNAT family N-acetyltransferase n=1 Tax=uncultured Methanomethylovorans sp. TaxID=183759 RepID=UPI002AA951AE|nr:GNAT family N-acetyltransferase [uncultured Methanomethylovorans sp.]
MEISNCTKSDFDQIIKNISDFWCSDRTLHLHHPTLIYEFGDSAFVIKDREIVCAYLFGFYSQTEPIAYTHLLAVKKDYRRCGLAQLLYEHFIECARKKGCIKMKAITKPTNLDSIGFHKSIGMKLIGNEIIDEITVVRDYNGPGEHRVVFIREI